jgi:hypothetical protein
MNWGKANKDKIGYERGIEYIDSVGPPKSVYDEIPDITTYQVEETLRKTKPPDTLPSGKQTRPTTLPPDKKKKPRLRGCNKKKKMPSF